MSHEYQLPPVTDETSRTAVAVVRGLADALRSDDAADSAAGASLFCTLAYSLTTLGLAL